MQKYILSAALLCLTVDARRERDQSNALDDNIVYREGIPSGYEAADDPADEDRKFIEWINGYRKNYSTLREMKQRFEAWRAANKLIRENNYASHHSGNPDAPFMDHNKFSDIFESEKKAMLGYSRPQGAKKASLPDEDEKRNLKALADKKINYSKKIMGEVQDQGSCGSCYAFASATPLEGTLTKRRIQAAKRENLNHKPIKWRGLSKQQVVDCTWFGNSGTLSEAGVDPIYARNFGCLGGWMEPVFDFYKTYGAMWETDYEYTSGAQDVREGTCEHKQEQVEVYAESYTMVAPNGYSMRQELRKAPLSIAVGVGDGLLYYKSGVIPADIQRSYYCTETPNHAVTLVGYTPGDIPNEDTQMPVTQCRPKTDEELNTQCAADHYEVRKFCCKDVEKTVSSSNGVWKIQNSWGEQWGEQGYYRAEFVGDGVGVCDMNTDVLRVEPDMDRFVEFETLLPN